MSSINDPEQLTGSSTVYANAKPGIIMDAFLPWLVNPNLVFIINRLDKITLTAKRKPASDVLLTLLDNLGFAGTSNV